MIPNKRIAGEIHGLSGVSAWRSAGALGFDWALIAATIGIAICSHNAWVYAVAIVMMARNQLALAVLMHEAAHGRLFRSRRWNNFAGHVLAAAPFFFSLNGYRRTHLLHHRVPLTPDDPDIGLTGGYPISKASMARKLFRDLMGITSFKFARHFFRAATGSGKASKRIPTMSCRHLETMTGAQELGWIVATNACIFALFYGMGHARDYFLLWILPGMTVLQVLLRIRGLAEHAGYRPGNDQRLLSRTVVNPVEEFFLGPHNVNYHIEHHCYPSLPFYQLPQAHAIFRKHGLHPEGNVYTSYRHVLKELTLPKNGI